MSKRQMNEMKPFLSLLLIVGMLFSVVIVKMEVRRMGYLVLKESRSYKSVLDSKRLKELRLAKIMEPERVRQIALSRLTLNEARLGQIVHLAGHQIALKQ